MTEALSRQTSKAQTASSETWKSRWLSFENPRATEYAVGAEHVSSYYAATAHLPQYEALVDDVLCDVVVVGGGFSGVSLARELAKSRIEVVMLEARRVGWGASGRNGGQVLPGLAKSTHEVRSKMGDDIADELWQISLNGLNSIHQNIADLSIECDLQRGHIYAAEKPRHERYLKAMLAEWQSVGYGHGRWLGKSALQEHFPTSRYTGAIYDKHAAHFHPLKYLAALAKDAHSCGARLFEKSPAVSIKNLDGRVEVSTPNGVVRAKRAVVAGNAYLPPIASKVKRVLHRETVSVASYVLVTKPIDAELLRSVFPSKAAVADLNFVVNYFRPLKDNRLLFGGGLNFGNSDGAAIEKSIRRDIQKYVPGLAHAETEYFWGGHVSMSRNYLPTLGHLDDEIIYVQGFSGHGVNVTHGVASEIAAHLSGLKSRFGLLASLKRSLFPGGHWLQTPLVLLGSAYAKISDRF